MGRQFLWRLKELQAGLDRVGRLERRAAPPAGGAPPSCGQKWNYNIASLDRGKSESKYNLLVSEDFKYVLII